MVVRLVLARPMVNSTPKPPHVVLRCITLKKVNPEKVWRTVAEDLPGVVRNTGTVYHRWAGRQRTSARSAPVWPPEMILRSMQNLRSGAQ